ncbi:MAG: 3-oxoacyl-ACP reductase family protein [Dehalococcoidia bacterium]|jgi:2-hydroxycyclohexanecarboxyl-CoA dehydrogenase|nr:3-oxoacyl-ACP reductase family protein [Dehalococcoidia bacterium]
MDLMLDGKTAIVTGGGRGIGEAICRTLAEDGARVAVNDYFEERAEETVAAVRDAGGTAIAVQADVTDREQVGAMVDRVIEEWGRVDILVNNAGIPARAPGEEGGGGGYFVDTDRTQWDRTMGVITYGVLNCTNAVLPLMIEQNYGKIVSIISDAGRTGEPRLHVYAMAKGGVVAFSKAIAKENGRFRINVNCVSPGATATPATGNLVEAAASGDEDAKARLNQMLRVYPIGRGLQRLGMPRDIANATTFLVSDRAEWITGQTLSVSGGYTMV